jgi:cytidylate kinase
VNKITIAIDGYSSCGKSTLAKSLAKELGYIYVDTGAMYRSATLYFIRNEVALDNEEQIAEALDNITISFQVNPDKSCNTILNGENVEEEIRGMEVSNMVSPVATVSAVRKAMVAQQRKMGENKGVVMDGRDIGTVVFPYAELKIFLNADTEIRAKRRLDEMHAKGIEIKFQEIKKNLRDRDRIDSTRKDSPLRKAFDAIEIDNTDMSRENQLEHVLDLANRIIKVSQNSV